jgi:hypothetical protein
VTIEVPPEWPAYILDVQVVGPDGRWSLLQTGTATWSLTLDADTVPAWLYPAIELDGASLYPEGCDDGGAEATDWIWVSPSWIDPAAPDLDGDGWAYADGDCDDTRADAHPGGVEVWYDGIDQDCDGNDDDQDGDGVPWPADCNDRDATVHPGARERWYDGIDQDCDGDDDDQDRDGSPRGADCDDTDAAIHPGATEHWYDGVDDDCDGNDDDRDGDGLPVTEDCDDAVPGGAPGSDGWTADCREVETPGSRCGVVDPTGLAGFVLAAGVVLGRRR